METKHQSSGVCLNTREAIGDICYFATSFSDNHLTLIQLVLREPREQSFSLIKQGKHDDNCNASIRSSFLSSNSLIP